MPRVLTGGPDVAKTWEVRNMAEADTIEAVAAAKRDGMTTAEWLTHAIRERISRERISRESAAVGEIMPPGEIEAAEPMPVPWSPLELIQNLEAYERVMRLRGKPISPRARVLVSAERLLRQRLLLIAPPVGTAPRKRPGDASGHTSGEKANSNPRRLDDRLDPKKPPPPSFTCPRCGSVSYNPHDIENRYCARCHVFHGQIDRLASRVSKLETTP